MTRQDAEKKLKTLFKFNNFYDLQWEVVSRIMQGQRVLFVAKTGYGKSLCFQFPATQFKGMTVVFSPLLALMRDQVNKLNQLGIDAFCINSEQAPEENEIVIEKAKSGQVKILYIAPERMENYEWLESSRQMDLSMVVIDEAHCISVWGHDFRPSYRRIINLVNLLPPQFPVLATTATATETVQQDIATQMGGKTKLIRGDLIRDNFRLSVVKVNSEAEKMAWLGMNVPKLSGNGIIYTGTRVNTKIFAKWLQRLGINTVNYSAALTPEARKIVEAGLFDNDYKCVVSTNALGMGIDKPDIRFIIHTQMPQSPTHYYQEIGRAGRDNLPTPIILLYNPEDRDLPQALIEDSKPSKEAYLKTIDALKTARVGERQLMESTNLRQTPLRVILADLIDQGIINQVFDGRSKKYEIKFNAPPLDLDRFEILRAFKFAELAKMIEYSDCTSCRMHFLTSYLGDTKPNDCGKCDNDRGLSRKVQMTPEWDNRIKAFWENNLPVLELDDGRSNMINGVAASYYGNTNIGAVIKKCKYGNGGNFPDFLLNMTLNAFKKTFNNRRFDLLLYVPPTQSGDLVKDFAGRLGRVLKIPVSDKLVKVWDTQPQKAYQNTILKRKNVKNAFDYKKPDELAGKNILLIDDIFDSGATMKEIGRMLTGYGVSEIACLTIAKTVGGDLDND